MKHTENPSIARAWEERGYFNPAFCRTTGTDCSETASRIREHTTERNIAVEAVGFAKCAHRQQKRKYTGEPYTNHCESVAAIVTEYTDDQEVIAAAVLHDVLEDTDVTPAEMRGVFGDRVTLLVGEVTDVSRLEDGNRETRKRLDREHLASSSPEGATIKLADLIDNTSSIVKHDKGFAKAYLQEKALLLDVLKHGNRKLWERAYGVLQEAQRELVQAALERAGA